MSWFNGRATHSNDSLTHNCSACPVPIAPYCSSSSSSSTHDANGAAPDAAAAGAAGGADQLDRARKFLECSWCCVMGCRTPVEYAYTWGSKASRNKWQRLLQRACAERGGLVSDWPMLSSLMDIHGGSGRLAGHGSGYCLGGYWAWVFVGGGGRSIDQELFEEGYSRDPVCAILTLVVYDASTLEVLVQILFIYFSFAYSHNLRNVKLF